MKFDVNVFKGGDPQRTVKIFKMAEDDLVMIPDESIVLASEVIDDTKRGITQVWVWAAVPNDNMKVASGAHTVSDENVNIKGESVPLDHPEKARLEALLASVVADGDVLTNGDDEEKDDE